MNAEAFNHENYPKQSSSPSCACIALLMNVDTTLSPVKDIHRHNSLMPRLPTLWEFMTVANIVGFGLNLLVLLIIFRSRKIRSYLAYRYIACLTIADLLYNILVFPINLYLLSSNSGRSAASSVTSHAAELHHIICSLHFITGRMTHLVSVLTLVIINVDKYIFFTRPFRYDTYFNKRLVMLICGTVWTVALAWAVLSFNFLGGRYFGTVDHLDEVKETINLTLANIDTTNHSEVMVSEADTRGLQQQMSDNYRSSNPHIKASATILNCRTQAGLLLRVVIPFLLYILTMLFSFVLSCRIMMIVYKQSNLAYKHCQDKNFVRQRTCRLWRSVFFVLVTTFVSILLIFPYWVVKIIDGITAGYSDDALLLSNHLKRILVFFPALNTTVNPFVTILTQRLYRRKFQKYWNRVASYVLDRLPCTTLAENLRTRLSIPATFSSTASGVTTDTASFLFTITGGSRNNYLRRIRNPTNPTCLQNSSLSGSVKSLTKANEKIQPTLSFKSKSRRHRASTSSDSLATSIATIPRQRSTKTGSRRLFTPQLRHLGQSKSFDNATGTAINYNKSIGKRGCSNVNSHRPKSFSRPTSAKHCPFFQGRILSLVNGSRSNPSSPATSITKMVETMEQGSGKWGNTEIRIQESSNNTPNISRINKKLSSVSFSTPSSSSNNSLSIQTSQRQFRKFGQSSVKLRPNFKSHQYNNPNPADKLWNRKYRHGSEDTMFLHSFDTDHTSSRENVTTFDRHFVDNRRTHLNNCSVTTDNSSCHTDNSNNKHRVRYSSSPIMCNSEDIQIEKEDGSGKQTTNHKNHGILKRSRTDSTNSDSTIGALEFTLQCSNKFYKSNETQICYDVNHGKTSCNRLETHRIGHNVPSTSRFFDQIDKMDNQGSCSNLNLNIDNSQKTKCQSRIESNQSIQRLLSFKTIRQTIRCKRQSSFLGIFQTSKKAVITTTIGFTQPTRKIFQKSKKVPKNEEAVCVKTDSEEFKYKFSKNEKRRSSQSYGSFDSGSITEENSPTDEYDRESSNNSTNDRSCEDNDIKQSFNDSHCFTKKMVTLDIPLAEFSSQSVTESLDMEILTASQVRRRRPSQTSSWFSTRTDTSEQDDFHSANFKPDSDQTSRRLNADLVDTQTIDSVSKTLCIPSEHLHKLQRKSIDFIDQ